MKVSGAGGAGFGGFRGGAGCGEVRGGGGDLFLRIASKLHTSKAC